MLRTVAIYSIRWLLFSVGRAWPEFTLNEIGNPIRAIIICYMPVITSAGALDNDNIANLGG